MEAALQANAVEADAEVPAITMVAEGSSSTTEITAAITGREALLHTVATMVLAALVAAILAGAEETESAHASFAALPGTRPNSALRQTRTS